MSYFDTALSIVLEDVESRPPRRIVKILLGKKSRWLQRVTRAQQEGEPQDVERRAEDVVRDARQWDPTPGHRYLQYIVQQIARGHLRLPEDGRLIKDALSVFETKGGGWAGSSDVFQYENWRKLQQDVNKHDNQPTQSSTDYMKIWRKLARDSSTVLFEKDILTTQGTRHYKVVQCDSWASVSLYGLGSQWCTTATPFRKIDEYVSDADIQQHGSRAMAQIKKRSQWLAAVKDNEPSSLFWPVGREAEEYEEMILQMNNLSPGTGQPLDAERRTKNLVTAPNPYFGGAAETAMSYLEDGPMIIIHKDNKPYLQLSGSEMRNAEDMQLNAAGGATSIILKELLEYIYGTSNSQNRMSRFIGKLLSPKRKRKTVTL